MTTLMLNNATLNGPGMITNAPKRTLSPTNSTINATLVNQKILNVLSTSALNKPFQNQARTTLQVAPAANIIAADLTVANGFINNGTIELTSANETITPALHVT